MTTYDPRADAAIRMLELQRDVASTLAATRDRDEAARAILAACLRVDEIDSGGVYVVDERTRNLHLAVHEGLGTRFVERVSFYPADAPQLRLASDHVAFAKPYRDVAPALDDARMSEGLEGIAIVALRCDGELVGVVNVASHVYEHLSEPSVAAIAAIAAVSGATLRRLALEAASREHDRNLAGLFDAASDLLFVVDTDARLLYANRAVERRLGYTAAELVQMTVAELYAPADREPAARVLGAMWRGDLRFCTIPLAAKNGEPVPVEISVSGGRWGDRPAMFGVSRDLTERLEAEAAVRESERQYRALFETMAQGVVYQQSDGRITAANPAAVRILVLSFDQLQGRTSQDPRWRAVRTDGSPFPGDEHPPMLALRTGCPVRNVVMGVDNPSTGSRRWLLVSSIPEIREPGEPAPNVFSTFDDITTRKQAEEELVRARDDLKRLASHLQTIAEEERKAVAREIHDELGQELTAMKLDLGWLQPRLTDPTGGVPQRLATLSAGVDRMLADVRLLARRLRPAILDDLGLVPAVRWLVDDFEVRVGVRIVARLPAELAPVDDRIAIALFRLVQESLTNVARHAGATRVDVGLRLVRSRLIVTVRDNGRGIDHTRSGRADSYGIVGMRERISSLGGTFTIGDAPGGGTIVRAEVPLGTPRSRKAPSVKSA